MQNDEGQNMDLYIPRKCSATNRLITSKDHASVQLNIGHVDENGIYTNQFTTVALCGFVRAQGDADSAVDRIWQKKRVELVCDIASARQAAKQVEVKAMTLSV